MAELRKESIIVSYLYNIFVVADLAAQLVLHLHSTLQLFQSLRCIINQGKSDLSFSTKKYFWGSYWTL